MGEVVAIKGAGMNWRVHEFEMLQKHFGPALELCAEDVTAEQILASGASYVLWAPHTECTSEGTWQNLCRVAALPVKHINDPRCWLACHAKEVAFEIWRREDIRCPDWFEFQNIEDFGRQDEALGYPLLMRLNNVAGGDCSYLVHDRTEAPAAWGKLREDHSYSTDGSARRGTHRKFLAVRYIPATLDDRVTWSFRIIVAGQKVVAGYARIGPLSDWVAITNRFEPWMEPLFVEAQRRCVIFCRTHEHEILRAVHCLGLNYQGVDVILDRDGYPYFLEVQPWFSTGYASSPGPFYNPSKPKSLVRFLIDNEPRLRKEIPCYYDRWLDKYAMFDEAFRALREANS